MGWAKVITLLLSLVTVKSVTAVEKNLLCWMFCFMFQFITNVSPLILQFINHASPWTISLYGSPLTIWRPSDFKSEIEYFLQLSLSISSDLKCIVITHKPVIQRTLQGIILPFHKYLLIQESDPVLKRKEKKVKSPHWISHPTKYINNLYKFDSTKVVKLHWGSSFFPIYQYQSNQIQTPCSTTHMVE